MRSGRWFDPALVEVLLAEAREDGLWEDLSRKDPWREVSRLEPDDRALKATPERVDLVARAFAEIIDAKSPFTYRHSEGVARVAVAMAERAGLGPESIRDLMRAALLHDIGKLGVSNRILDKPGGLTDGEYEEIKRHPKLTYDNLSRVGPFRPIAETAANHHEKLDGSGYHRGIGAEDLDLPPASSPSPTSTTPSCPTARTTRPCPRIRSSASCVRRAPPRSTPGASPSSNTWPPKTRCKAKPDAPRSHPHPSQQRRQAVEAPRRGASAGPDTPTDAGDIHPGSCQIGATKKPGAEPRAYGFALPVV